MERVGEDGTESGVGVADGEGVGDGGGAGGRGEELGGGQVEGGGEEGLEEGGGAGRGGEDGVGLETEDGRESGEEAEPRLSHSRGTPLSHLHCPVGQLRSRVVGPEYVGHRVTSVRVSCRRCGVVCLWGSSCQGE